MANSGTILKDNEPVCKCVEIQFGEGSTATCKLVPLSNAENFITHPEIGEKFDLQIEGGKAYHVEADLLKVVGQGEYHAEFKVLSESEAEMR